MDPDTFQNAWAVLDVVMDEMVRRLTASQLPHFTHLITQLHVAHLSWHRERACLCGSWLCRTSDEHGCRLTPPAAAAQVRMRIGAGAKIAADPAHFVERLASQSVLTIASGGQGTTQKFYVYAGAEGGQGTFLVELNVDVPSDSAQAVVKTDALHHGEAFSQFLSGLLGSYTGLGEW